MCIYTYIYRVENYSAIKKECNLLWFGCDIMDGLRGYYDKWNKSEKENDVWFCLYVESKKQSKWKYEQHKNTPK